MSRHEIEDASTTEGLPVAPSLGPTLARVDLASRATLIGRRDLAVAAMAVALALVVGGIAQLLTRMIGLVTNLAYYGRLATDFVSPADHQLGALAVLVPIVGGLTVGVMARFGSAAIRGHGIPEAMEHVLTNGSRIPARMTLLKPVSAAVAIGTGGPFGAEGPIIATGGALGSLLGQAVPMSPAERKTLLAAGAAAGMAATFGSPVSAVLLAVELLLFEYRPRSLVPVALAAIVATTVRAAIVGTAPMFAMPDVPIASAGALVAYVLLGAVVGAAAIAITRLVYGIEDAFARLPLHWMWWPALGSVVVGLVGLAAPRTLGVGYDNIERIVAGDLGGAECLAFCAWKLLSWSIALGSGTSGGTLAPLFTIGGGLGAVLGGLAGTALPQAGVDVRVAALVGMAAMFAGASRAPLASVVFAFETTRQFGGLLPLLGGCTAGFLVSCVGMPTSMMTEKIERRGVRVVGEYVADYLSQVTVRDVALRSVVTLRADTTVGAARRWLASRVPGSDHHGFPVVDADDRLVGVVTRRDVFETGTDDARLADLVGSDVAVVYDDCSLRDAADRMATRRIGRLPVVHRARPDTVIGIVTRSDLVDAHARRLAS
ncbi:MAG: chloride channel protein [Deltaproteobacteria bacterium]|nr:chloride channel protein [Deltaproteobacteria bacterium]